MKKPPETHKTRTDLPAPRPDAHVRRQPAPDGRHITGENVTQLQRSAGNTAVNHLLRVQREGPQAPGEPNFDELIKAYQDARENEHALYDRRLIGADEALKNLGEADAPSIGDIILHAAIMGALGFASGGITQALTGKIVASTASNAIQTAVQSGLDDAFKDAVPAVVDKVLSRESTSRSSFFAGLQEGIVELRKGAVRGLNAEELKVKTAARANPATLAAAVKAIQDRAAAVDTTAQTARDLQYRESLSQWLIAMAKGELGTTEAGGAKLRNMPGYGGDPSRMFHQDSTAGVLRLSIGMKSAHRPLTINYAQLEGLNDATKEQLKNTTLNDLRIPIFAQGWIFDGFLDGLGKGDNEVSMTRNEQGFVTVNWGSDAEDAMLSSSFAKGQKSVPDVAFDIMQNDIGKLKLGSIRGIT